MDQMQASRFSLTGSALKIIVSAAMLFDHVFKILGVWVIANYLPVLQSAGDITSEIAEQVNEFILYHAYSFGTIAFPIYCFLLVEGFSHTKDIRKYVQRLLAFAVISEIPFDLAIFGRIDFGYQNVFFTLLLGLLMICAMGKCEKKEYLAVNNAKNIITQIGRAFPFVIVQIGTPVFFALMACIIKCDYEMRGILYIFVFYINRSSRLGQIIAFLIAYAIINGRFPTIYMFLACGFISLYNGKRGMQLNKYFFYAFYPVHLFILYVATQIMSATLI